MNITLIHVPGDVNGDSSAELTEIERLDKEMVERWKGEADSILVFAGLFTAVVSVSLVESYKWLSPDSGDQTVELLNQTIILITQASQQFYNYSHGIPVENIAAANTSSLSFEQTPDVLAVNILWFNSLVIGIGCAIIATLIQKWARRYLALTQGRGTPAKRARVRKFLSNGLRKFRVNWVRQLLGMLLHYSIFVYCLGIIVFIFHIDLESSTAALSYYLTPSAGGYLFICFLIYATVTILPFFFLDCPYSTPYTPLTWHLYHLCIFGICLPILAILYLCNGSLTVCPTWTTLM
ncbi:hypothetical protein V8E53_006839 [Lactarius tabidus]